MGNRYLFTGGEKVMEFKPMSKDKSIQFVIDNAAYRWQFEFLESRLKSLQNILVDAGILVEMKEMTGTVYVVDGQPYVLSDNFKSKEK